MKIIQLVTRRQYRGAEVFASELSLALQEAGHQVFFLGLYMPGRDELSVDGANNLDLSARSSQVIDVGAVNRLRTIIRELQPDIVQANGSDTLKYAVLALIFEPAIPLVYRNISIISKWLGHSFTKKVLYRLLFWRVDHVVSVGNEARLDLVSSIHYPMQKTSVVHRGIRLTDFNKEKARHSVLKQFGLSDTDRLVVHVGSFSAEKNHMFLVEVFKLLKEANTRTKLILVGDGPFREEVRRSVQDNQLEEMIFFAGFRRDKETYLAAADLCLLCSTVEGVPGVVLEAASLGVPSLAVNVGGVSEAIISERTGWLLANHESGTFAEMINQLTGNERLLFDTGQKAKEHVMVEFSMAAVTTKFVELYQNLAALKGKKDL